METYKKEAADSTTGQYGVVFKNTAVDSYQVSPTAYASEAEAEKAAEDKVTSGAVDAQVLSPSGARFIR